MDVAELKNAIRRVIRDHAQAFREIGSSQPKLLELAAITGLAEHYRSHGYQVTVVNPKTKKRFAIKSGTRGYPWNFSRIVAVRQTETVELHMNLMVRSAHDDGIYCVDVGVVRTESVPSAQPKGGWTCVGNSDLLTFAEAKKLVVYPMLLAQFLGIVHEIRPEFLRPAHALGGAHLPPILIALGHFSGNAAAIVGAYASRGIKVTIAENYDVRLARVRGRSATSPFS